MNQRTRLEHLERQEDQRLADGESGPRDVFKEIAHLASGNVVRFSELGVGLHATGVGDQSFTGWSERLF
jgi:hypothetical protein